jgi:hypothetical protein
MARATSRPRDIIAATQERAMDSTEIASAIGADNVKSVAVCCSGMAGTGLLVSTKRGRRTLYRAAVTMLPHDRAMCRTLFEAYGADPTGGDIRGLVADANDVQSAIIGRCPGPEVMTAWLALFDRIVQLEVRRQGHDAR